MIRRFAPLLAVPLLVVLAGCSSVGDAARDIAGEAASQAGSAAVAELQEQICTTIEDGQLSEQDKDVLAGLLTAAEAAGVPAEFLNPIDSIAGGDGQVSRETIDALLDACGNTATPAPSNG
ncbi:hypothetical protein [Mycetocola zhadangensis]|uniref:Lipoprotein n=1 Tax=Mycetocola zhadangensis TaxID=1164595 RepID=A0A3L7J106_9MICO|nr:hypothetical protein [Mycetocola zhadangensis]RLQ84147.1 hypothetical protein D9V28_07915 [Mycetocola zhadangensis]GGE95749.1 hypothetical protein GCM10011313_18370 [Mycetocola zhadangensis]